MNDRDSSIDPVLRCMSCGKLLLVTSLKKHGCCINCGNKRVSDVKTISGEEMERLRKKGVDDRFLALFEEAEVDNDDII